MTFWRFLALLFESGSRKGRERAVWLAFEQIEQKLDFLAFSATFVRERTAQGPRARGLARFRAKCGENVKSDAATTRKGRISLSYSNTPSQ